MEAIYHKKPDQEKDYDKRVLREWNTVDFVGKFHLSRFKNKITPIPGTQTTIERDYDEDVEKFHKRLEEKNEERARQSELKQAVKLKSTEFRSKIFFDTVIGGPMTGSENVLKEKEQLLMNEFKPPVDEMKNINKFIMNCELNRSHYVGYAASVGYQSINYQHPSSGNTALHLAVRKGHIETVNELLKYKADPDVKNKLGNHPIHECWLFWKTHANRTKEERIEQEEKTCQLLLSILSYNGSVDAPDVKGQTALHIACRLGPVQAVKTILSFKADFMLCLHNGKSCQDIALEFGNEETYKLLNSWSLIRKHLVNLDFHMVWHRFLKDYEAIISSHKSAETILTEVHMEVNIRQLERDSTFKGVPIEDSLLNDAYLQHRNIVQIIPKPWEPGWAAYVKHAQDAGVVDLKSKLEALTKKKKGFKKPKGVKKDFSLTAPLPDRPTPLARPRLLHPLGTTDDEKISTSIGGSGAKHSLSVSSSSSSNNSRHSSHHSQSVSGVGANRKQLMGKDLAQGSSVSSVTKITIEEGNEDEEDEEETDGHYDGDDTNDNEDVEEQSGSPRDVYAVERYSPKKSQSLSSLDKRRQNLAHAMLKDAKFLKFTNRLTTNSALLIPLRAPEAPLEGTEEESSIMRRIVSQGPDFEKFNKYKKHDRFSELLGIKHDIPVNSIGAYYRAADYMVPNKRDMLYESLVDKKGIQATPTVSTLNAMSSAVGMSALAGVNEDVAPTSKKEALDREAIANHAKVVDLMTQSKIDLVNDSRPRYVKADLLPAKRVISVVEVLSNKKKESEAKELRQKVGLGSESSMAAARAEIEAKIAQSALEAAGQGGETEESHGGELKMKDLFNSKKKADERNLVSNNMFLKKETVKYGAGRITSTHNSMGKIEEPWTTVGGRYKTIPGDRTA